MLLATFSLFGFEELKLIEGKILLGQRVSELFDSVLEIRRFERNYFLHGQAADYQENVRYVETTLDLMDRNGSDFALIGKPEYVAKLRGGLLRYRALMAEYASAADSENRSGLEPRVRLAGQEIVAIADDILATERRLVRSSLNAFRTILVVSIVGTLLLLIAVAQALSMRVVQPLKKIEESVNAVSSGKRDTLSLPSRDREIVSITNAFNQMLRELELRQKHLLRSEKLASLGTMLSGVAHELNNPLSNIWTSCQILEEELETATVAERRELLRQIDEQSVRARNIVRSLLDFARDREFVKEPLLLRPLLLQTVRFIKGEVPTDVAVNIEIADELQIFADKQRIQQVFINLVRNAVEAVAGHGNVTIRARQRGAQEAKDDAVAFPVGCGVDRDSIDITVADDGPGIDPEVLPRIFDPFFTTKDVGNGMGLGLFIVYEIVDEHDGCIAASSETGQGTVFHIRLPLQEV